MVIRVACTWFDDLIFRVGFPAVEKGVVKPRVAADDAGRPDAETRERIKDGIAKVRYFLTCIEANMSSDGYIFGDQPSWADFFLFPQLADLNAIPERELINERLQRWMKLMNELDAVKMTSPGTLSVGARPP